MDLRVLNDFLLIKRDEDEFTDSNPEVVRIVKEGLITLPETYQGALRKVAGTGVIESIGPYCRETFVIGDRVIFAQFSFQEVPNSEGENLILVKEKDVLAKDYRDRS